MEKIIVSCLESRVEANRSIYARFLLGPFTEDYAVTIGTALRRALLSKVKNIAITAIHIQGVTHEFSTIVGVRESVLDLALNFQQIVLRTQINNCVKTGKVHKTTTEAESLLEFESETAQVGYLQMQGPAVIHANDLKLPLGVECVDPTQYIATLSQEGLLVVKFLISEKKASFNNNNGTLTVTKINESLEGKNKLLKNYNHYDVTSVGVKSLSQASAQESKKTFSLKVDSEHQALLASEKRFKRERGTGSPETRTTSLRSKSRLFTSNFRSFDSTICLRNTIFLDPTFNSVFQVNYIIEKDDLCNQPRERIVLELWTNGSIHPRQAIHQASFYLLSTFSIFRKVFDLDSW